jgi:hypothetical protein
VQSQSVVAPIAPRGANAVGALEHNRFTVLVLELRGSSEPRRTRTDDDGRKRHERFEASHPAALMPIQIGVSST